MVVRDFYIMRVPVAPSKADSPLLIDADTVLSRSISFECFQPVAGRNPQFAEMNGCVQHPEFPHGNSSYVRRQPAGTFAMKDSLCFLALERQDHGRLVTRHDISVKRYYQLSLETQGRQTGDRHQPDVMEVSEHTPLFSSLQGAVLQRRSNFVFVALHEGIALSPKNGSLQ